MKSILESINSKLEDFIFSENLKNGFGILNLPSEGRYYKNKKSSLMIKYLTYYEEKTLCNYSLFDAGLATEYLLKTVIIDKDIDINDLLKGDINAILMFLSSTAYGDTVPVDIICPECEYKTKIDLKISSFKSKEVKVLPDENMELGLFLPISQKNIKLKVLTYKQEKEVFKLGLKNIDIIKKSIVQVDDIRDEKYISSFISSAPLQDSRKIREFIEDNFPGIDGKINYTCSNCDHNSTHIFNFDEDFLKLPESYLTKLYDEIFSILYFGKGYTENDLLKKPVIERRWILNRLSKQIQEENDKQKKEMAKTKK